MIKNIKDAFKVCILIATVRERNSYLDCIVKGNNNCLTLSIFGFSCIPLKYKFLRKCTMYGRSRYIMFHGYLFYMLGKWENVSLNVPGQVCGRKYQVL